MSYDDLLAAVAAGRVVMVTFGIDLDGDRVACTSMFDATPLDDTSDWLLDADPDIRVNCLVGAVRAVAEQLETLHGIRCS